MAGRSCTGCSGAGVAGRSSTGCYRNHFQYDNQPERDRHADQVHLGTATRTGLWSRSPIQTTIFPHFVFVYELDAHDDDLACACEYGQRTPYPDFGQVFRSRGWGIRNWSRIRSQDVDESAYACAFADTGEERVVGYRSEGWK